MFMNLKDWKQAVRTPPAYRVGNSTLRIQTQFVAIITLVGFLTLIVIYRSTDKEKVQKVAGYGIHDLDKVKLDYAKSSGRSNELAIYDSAYNSTYPLTRPVKVHDALQFRIALVTDLDHSSSSKLESNTWVSYMKKGYLMWTPGSYGISITWDKPTMTTLKTTYGHSGRGMELSELVTYDGKLLTFDDRSGIVYIIDKEKVYPWVILLDGDGKVNKGFKSEWATVKDQFLYVGGMGKEWTTSSGEFVNTNPMWVKRISRQGEVTHLDWTAKYKALRSKLGIEFPGYMLHESGTWSEVHKRWFFLPRRMSKLRYDEVQDEKMGTNVLLSCDDSFTDIKVVYIGEVLPTHGFSSFKFVPGTNDEVIVALKTSEYNGQTATYVMAFMINGKILMGETKVADLKFEGLEFV